MNNSTSEESGNTQPDAAGAIRVLEDMMETPIENKFGPSTPIGNINYTSKAEESFIKYANLLETIQILRCFRSFRFLEFVRQF